VNKKEIVMTNKPKIILKPKTEWDSWREELVVAAKRTYTPMEGSYHSEELSAPAIRPGADDHMNTQADGVALCVTETVERRR
jgi:hypothetical protein